MTARDHNIMGLTHDTRQIIICENMRTAKTGGEAGLPDSMAHKYRLDFALSVSSDKSVITCRIRQRLNSEGNKCEGNILVLGCVINLERWHDKKIGIPDPTLVYVCLHNSEYEIYINNFWMTVL